MQTKQELALDLLEKMYSKKFEDLMIEISELNNTILILKEENIKLKTINDELRKSKRYEPKCDHNINLTECFDCYSVKSI